VTQTASDVPSDRWLAADQAALWEAARVVAVCRDPSATTLRLHLPETPVVLPGQYYLVQTRHRRSTRRRPTGVLALLVGLPIRPEIEITVREVEGGRASPLLARRVQVDDVLAVRGPFGFLTWTEQDGGPVALIGAGSGVAPLVSIVRYAAARGIETPMTMLCSTAIVRRCSWPSRSRSCPPTPVVHARPYLHPQLARSRRSLPSAHRRRHAQRRAGARSRRAGAALLLRRRTGRHGPVGAGRARQPRRVRRSCLQRRSRLTGAPPPRPADRLSLADRDDRPSLVPPIRRG